MISKYGYDYSVIPVPPLMSDDDVSHVECYTVYMCVFPQSLCSTLCADPTLNIDNLRLVMVSVKDWYHLGMLHGGLNIPLAVCGNIQSSHVYKTEEEKKEALLLYYLLNSPKASWQHVVGALHYWEEVTALKAAKAFLKYTHGQFLIILHVHVHVHRKLCTATTSIQEGKQPTHTRHIHLHVHVIHNT